MRTPRGREATARAYERFGYRRPGTAGGGDEDVQGTFFERERG